jgi:hypothetical protein
MGVCTTDLSYANEEQVFCILEDVCGTLKRPTASSRIYCQKAVNFDQQQNFIDDEQVRATASEFASIKGPKNPGTASFDTYVKPSGTAGTAPEVNTLLRCGLGTATPDPGVSVVYTLANQLESLSLWILKGNVMFAMRGCGVDTVDWNISGNAIASMSWGLQFMEQSWAGTYPCNMNAVQGTTVITMATKGAQLYCVGMPVKVGTDDNNGAGYVISAVNYTLNTITIPALLTAQGTNPTIAPWYPTSSAEVGAPVHGKMGIVTIGGANAVILSSKISLKNNLKYYTDEKNGLWTPERFGRPAKRQVTGQIDMNLLSMGPSYFYRAEYQVNDALIIPCGNVAGYMMKLTIPYAEYTTPKIGGDAEFTESLAFKAIASATMNDEISATYY